MLLITTLTTTLWLVKTSLEGVLLWDDPDQDQLSKIAPILMEESTLTRMDLMHHNLSDLLV